MGPMVSNILKISLCYFSYSALADTFVCKEFQTRYLSNKKFVEQRETLCIDKKKNIVASKDCVKADPSCSLIKRVQNSTIDNKSLLSEVGSPAFKLCHFIDGLPQDMEYLAGKEWVSASRCIDPKTTSFINLDRLMTEVK